MKKEIKITSLVIAITFAAMAFYLLLGVFEVSLAAEKGETRLSQKEIQSICMVGMFIVTSLFFLVCAQLVKQEE